MFISLSFFACAFLLYFHFDKTLSINDSKAWEHFDLTKFSFSSPYKLNKQDIHGIDSYVGKYDNDEMTVTFDYGIYSNNLSFCQNSKWVLINYRPAKICSYKEDESDNERGDKEFITAVYFPYIDLKSNALTLYISYKEKIPREAAEQMIYSIKFK